MSRSQIRQALAYLNARCSPRPSSPSPAQHRGMTSKTVEKKNYSVRSSVHLLEASDTSAYCNVAPIYDTPLRRLALCPRCRCAAIEPYSGLEDPPWRTNHDAPARPQLLQTCHDGMLFRSDQAAVPATSLDHVPPLSARDRTVMVSHR